MSELETALREAGERFPFGPTPDVVDVTLLEPGRNRRRRWIPAVVIPLAVAAVASGALAVSALRGVHVESVDSLPPFPTDAAPPFLGEPVDLATAREAVPWRLAVPRLESLGPPEVVFLRNDVPGGIVTLEYGDDPRARLSQWRGDISDATYQLLSGESRIERLTIEGREAVWLEGRVQATYTYIGADGAKHREALPAAGHILLWEDDGIAFRLATLVSRDRAVEIAEAIAGS